MPLFEQLERPRFFTGQLLTAADLEEEQAYFLGRARRHNRFLHGWGIVSGLGVAIEDGLTVVVAAGLALDCAGNELVLAAPERLSLAGLAGKHYVTLRYLEIPTGQQPSAQGEEEARFSRVREAVQVELAGLNPAAGHRGMGPGSAGCGQAHALCLASVSLHGSHWRIASAKRSVRRRR